MKIATIVLTIIAVGLIIFNLTQINWEDPLTAESTVPLITILASLCAIVLLQILRISKKIEKLNRGRRF